MNNEDAQKELEQEIEEMRESGKYNEEEIEQFKKNRLVKKSLDEIRKRAEDLKEVRNSP